MIKQQMERVKKREGLYLEAQERIQTLQDLLRQCKHQLEQEREGATRRVQELLEIKK